MVTALSTLAEASDAPCIRKTKCLTLVLMADTITIRTDEETERALDVLTHGGLSRSAAIRQAVLEAASRRERAAAMRRAVLRMDIGQPDGVNVAEELARDRAGER
jgi:predicted transcriptional regulator